MKNMIKVGLVQQKITKDSSKNLSTTCNSIRLAAAQGARLIVLQELHLTPYFCQTEDPDNFDLAEPIPGPVTEALSKVAKELRVIIVGSIFEKRGKGIYHNTAVVIDQEGELAGKYRKMHIPDDPGYYEKYYFTPGDLGFITIPTIIGKLGVLVCWDQWFPEAARLMALQGADLLIYPTAIGWDPRDPDAEKERQIDAWRTIQRAHAIANGIPVISCNRTGLEKDPSGQTPGIDFWGNSMIIGQQGELLAEGGSFEDCILTASIDLAQNEQIRRRWPFLRDRRVSDYSGLLNLYNEEPD